MTDCDTLVIGSGIGGLVAAAALARRGRRVLVLERHSVPGGQTQTFTRGEWTFATGLHYIGDAGPDGNFSRLLRTLGDGSLQFAPLPERFDLVRLADATQPDGELRFAFGPSLAADLPRLQALFPAEAQGLAAYLQAYRQARRDAMRAMPLHGMPRPLAALLRWWHGDALRAAAGLTVAQALASIGDARLRALLAARGGDYGLPPDEAPLLLHALVLGSYEHGAWVPVGGPARIAQSLLATVQAHGGGLCTGADVVAITVEGGRACGVQLADGTRLAAAHVVSGMGAANTARALPAGTADPWRAAIAALPPSDSYIALYLGLDADPRTLGLDGANQWIYASGPQQLLWTAPADSDPPSLFVSFPSVHDPQHPGKPVAEVIVPCRWDDFAALGGGSPGRRDEDYLATKAWVEDRLLTQVLRWLPQLRSHIGWRELATPLTQAGYTGAPHGAMYGLRATPRKLLAPELHARTPVPGLSLAGQDVASLGIEGAAMGGLLAAATVDPALFQLLRG